MARHHQIGFRILPAPPRIDDALAKRFVGLASSNLADAMGRFNFMDDGIRCRTGVPVSGRVVTVVCRPGDNLMVHKAMEVALPGDIIVVSTGGDTVSAVFGEMMCTAAMRAGLGGIVVDGAIRDVDALTDKRFPAFSRALCPGGCDKDGPGEINVPISCGSAVVMPGDIVVGDLDGLAVVRREEAVEVIELVTALIGREKKRIAEINAGVTWNPDIDATLRKRGIIE